MSTIIKFQPLVDNINSSICCYLLQLDEFSILLDCGWDVNLSPDIIEHYKSHLRNVDAVVLSHPDICHLGALPFLHSKCGLSCPIYATVPIHKMGLMYLYDLCESRLSAGYSTDLFSLDDVDSAFDSITQLKYCQSVRPKSQQADIVVTPLPAGHTIGCTIWRIVKDSEEHILYAPDFNHRPERHLNSCSFEGESKASAALAGASKRRPVLIITNPGKIGQLKRRRIRDEQLTRILIQVASIEGNCLILSDSGGRLLELLLTLDELWLGVGSKITLVFLSYVASSVVEFARSMVEWMSDRLTTSFEQTRNNPFRLVNYKVCNSRAQLDNIRGAKVIVSSSCDLEYGLGRQLFLEMCQNESDTIVMTLRSPKRSYFVL